MLERLAALLEYPESRLREGCEAARAACAGVHPRAAAPLAAFAGAVARMDLHALQELYARTFDFDGDTALYVGHHLFAEDGRRGLFIAGMTERYARLGMSAGGELADHFAPVLRSLARDRDSEEARDLVGAALLPALAKVLPAVERRAAIYGALLHAVGLVLDDPARAIVSRGSEAWTSSSSPSSRT